MNHPEFNYAGRSMDRDIIAVKVENLTLCFCCDNSA